MIGQQILDKFTHKKAEDECWPWQGRLNPKGYGVHTIIEKGFRINWLAHRLSYFLNYGELNSNLVIMHICDNPRCVNPKHLKQVTQAENNADMAQKKRHGQNSKTHCKRGHEFTNENTYMKGNERVCKICKNREQNLRRGHCLHDYI